MNQKWMIKMKNSKITKKARRNRKKTWGAARTKKKTLVMAQESGEIPAGTRGNLMSKTRLTQVDKVIGGRVYKVNMTHAKKHQPNKKKFGRQETGSTCQKMLMSFSSAMLL